MFWNRSRRVDQEPATSRTGDVRPEVRNCRAGVAGVLAHRANGLYALGGLLLTGGMLQENAVVMAAGLAVVFLGSKPTRIRIEIGRIFTANAEFEGRAHESRPDSGPSEGQ
jgi:hypothetical protein